MVHRPGNPDNASPDRRTRSSSLPSARRAGEGVMAGARVDNVGALVCATVAPTVVTAIDSVTSGGGGVDED